MAHCRGTSTATSGSPLNCRAGHLVSESPLRRRPRRPVRRRSGHRSSGSCSRSTACRRSGAVASPRACGSGASREFRHQCPARTCGPARCPSGRPCGPSFSVTGCVPGTATRRSAVAPSFHCSALTANGCTPGAGTWRATSANKPRLAQLAREIAGPAGVGVGDQAVQAAAFEVADQQFAVGVLAEADDTQVGPRDLAVRGEVLAVRPLDLGGPDPARFPVAEDVLSGQFRQPLAAVDVAAGDRGGLGVRQGQVGLEDRRRAERVGRVVDVDRLRAFHDAPAVVPAGDDRGRSSPTVPSRRRPPTVGRSRGRSSSSTGCAARTPRPPAAPWASSRTGCRRGSSTACRRLGGPRRSAGRSRAGR